MFEIKTKYENDNRLLSMAQLEKILIKKYGTTANDDSGCYLNQRWFSIAAILEEVSANI